MEKSYGQIVGEAIGDGIKNIGEAFISEIDNRDLEIARLTKGLMNYKRIAEHYRDKYTIKATAFNNLQYAVIEMQKDLAEKETRIVKLEKENEQLKQENEAFTQFFI